MYCVLFYPLFANDSRVTEVNESVSVTAMHLSLHSCYPASQTGYFKPVWKPKNCIFSFTRNRTEIICAMFLAIQCLNQWIFRSITQVLVSKFYLCFWAWMNSPFLLRDTRLMHASKWRGKKKSSCFCRNNVIIVFICLNCRMLKMKNRSIDVFSTVLIWKMLKTTIIHD